MPFRALMLFLLLFCGTVASAAVQSYDQAGFAQARKDGGPVLLMVHADWCPTCRAQASVMKRLAGKPEFAAFRIFRMDYDKEKNGMVLAFRVNRQSALLVFKGGKEVARSVGETDEEAIAALMRKGL
jgi:thiol-disulfide isomerase/thioredoxin